MKHLILSIFVLLLFSCSESREKQSGEDYSDFSISMDTVIVDSGEDILMAATNPFGHSSNSDNSSLIFYEGKSAELEIVDLKNLQLLEKKTFEKEGPNGIGQNVYQARWINDNLIAFSDWNKITLADFDGNVQQRIDLSEDWVKAGLGVTDFLSMMGFSNDGKLMYCSITNFSKINSNIVQVDIENKTTKFIELPEFEKRENFRVSFKNENGGTSMNSPNLSMDKNYDKVIFWTNVINNVYVYDPKTDSLRFEMITNNIFPNEKMGTYVNDVTSNEARAEEINKINQEISFSSLLWDDKNNVYYRFAHQQLPKIADEPTKYKTYISIIDESYNVVGEKEITDIIPLVPNAKFVRDGKIYLFLNVDDELGYVRLKIN
ncbi:DUF4221 domain-containing protein [Belliella sp. R4-6]|uniref:DUF4221 domain-containing protein n=1 Tax=Belliella alkalica TaxID=1730871 RepID=A0ABS9VDE9_9BACT|nr:DUF4221 family protein [Belliella alkalica]MCH7414075.1 DUF4221 domain-containing protein [Belliella alkalica]